MNFEPGSPIQFGSRRDREDATYTDKVISFSAQGRLWTLVVEEARTTRYHRKCDERYLRANLMIGSGLPAEGTHGLILPDRLPAKVTFSRSTGDLSEVVLVASLEPVRLAPEVAA